MAKSWFFNVAIPQPHRPEWPPARTALADAEALATAFGNTTNETRLVGPDATFAVVQSHLRRLKKQLRAEDQLVVAWTGPTTPSGELILWDTLADDLAGTAFQPETLMGILAGGKSAPPVFVWNIPSGGTLTAPERGVALYATDSGEPLHDDGKQSVWLKLVAEALRGAHRKALNANHQLSAESLQGFLETELPRRLRQNQAAGARQTPVLLGDGSAILRTFAANDLDTPGILLDPARLRRVVFQNEIQVRIKDLIGYRKTITLPTSASPSSRKFITRLAQPDIKADLDEIYELVRECLGTKRKELVLDVGNDGLGSLKTPDFVYTVFADLDDADPTRLRWRREVGHFENAEFILSESFAEVFGTRFDRLVFEFAKPVDVSEFVDDLEDAPREGIRVRADSDGTHATIQLAGHAGEIQLRRHTVIIRGRGGRGPELLQLFLQFSQKFQSMGEPLALPPARG
ncbi:MAG: hypothetical protein ACRCZF_26610 [Gemmataceae bacterium]